MLAGARSFLVGWGEVQAWRWGPGLWPHGQAKCTAKTVAGDVLKFLGKTTDEAKVPGGVIMAGMPRGHDEGGLMSCRAQVRLRMDPARWCPPHGEVWASLDKKEQAALLDPVVKPLIEAGRGGSPRGAGRTNKAQLSVSLTMVQAANAKRLAELDGKKKDFIQLLKAAC